MPHAGVQYVLPDAVLLALAQARPQQPRELRAAADAAARQAAESTTSPATDGGDDALTVVAGALTDSRLAALRHDAPRLCALFAQAASGVREWAPWKALAAAAAGGRADRKVWRNNPAAQAERFARMVRKFAAKGPVYEGCRMLSSDGRLLCHTDRRKVSQRWSGGIAGSAVCAVAHVCLSH